MLCIYFQQIVVKKIKKERDKTIKQYKIFYFYVADIYRKNS